ncbi:MAG: hypothetical protein IJ165_02985 [Proteobacteria bacterium]|nr:hypothetical protein [Pseudomonadota bacterium]
MTNAEIIKKLRRLNTLLTLKKCSNNLALAVRKAIETIEGWDSSVETHLEHTPVKILFAGYGPKFIRIFEELIQTGDIELIHKLQPEFDPFFCDLCEIPGIGETMARRMFFDRSIRSMDDLRIAYTNNILQRIPSFGEARFKAIETVLWHSQGKDHPSWSELPADALLPNKAPEPEVMSSQLELFSTSDLEKRMEESNAEGDSSVPQQAPERMRSRNACPASYDSARHSEIAEKARSLTELFEALDRQADSEPSGKIRPAEVLRASEGSLTADVSRPVNMPETRDVHYSQEFRDSNSYLFRESQPANVSDSEREADFLLKTSSESELETQIDSALCAPVSEDPVIASQLRATIAKDLEEHGLPLVPVAEDVLCARNIVAGTVRADVLTAETIHARVVCAQVIQMYAVPDIQADVPLLQGDLSASEISAETVEAECIEAREVHCRYLIAQMVREK